MCNNKFKKVMSLICATTCILSLSIPCMAADTTSPEDSVIELRMTNINDAQCVLTVKDGKAAARAEVGGKRGSEKCKIVLKIQVQQGTRWVTVDSWTVEKDGRNASIEESVKAESGKSIGHRPQLQFGLMEKLKARPLPQQAKQHKPSNFERCLMFSWPSGA